MKLYNLANREKRGYTTWGCMWKRGTCTREHGFVLMNSDGTRVPMQSRITAWWPDGTVKWTAHTADAGRLTEEIMVEKTMEPSDEDIQAIRVTETKENLEIKTSRLFFTIPKDGSFLFDTLKVDGTLRAEKAKPVLILEEPVLLGEHTGRIEKNYEGTTDRVSVEEEGPVRVIVKYEGIHSSKNGEEKIPYIIRMKIGQDTEKIDIVHTFLYDGEEEKDFLKGIGLKISIPMEGELYNRHVVIEGDYGVFHESVAELLTWRPKVPEEIYKAQMRGEKIVPTGEAGQIINQVMKDMPFWYEYDLCQDSPGHYQITKKTAVKESCALDCLHGTRTRGAAAFGGEQGSMLLSIRDFWQTYPSGYTFRGLTGDKAEAFIWLYSPKAAVMDFRHYADRGYNQVYYEGYDYKGATPYGIASTSEYSIEFTNRLVLSEDELKAYSDLVNNPAQYVGTPEFYHENKAFGYWSLPERTSEMEQWLEEQLGRAVDFYQQEVEQRNWYGLFNYGDFMHTYDRERHQWRYDMGGYAWDNTELVPTLWLWLMFMRTGRPDVFSLAEKLSRHASEVDVYHIGDYKGLGSRHNVRHWGCPCKEARIAMAGHHRYYYYMTGDYRLEDIFEELKDNETTFLNKDPLRDFYEKDEMVFPSHARSGPDWSALCANWMTRWERVQDIRYRDKIKTGMEDIRQAPLRLVSGPDFEFDPASAHLRYIGERAAGGTHLQICMGAPQIWMELADLLEDEGWKEMLADYGRFYYLPREKQLEESGGIIGEREFSLPFMAAAMGAYGAYYRKDEALANVTWSHLLHAILCDGNHEGFQAVILRNQGNQAELEEIPWISTNFTAQWCLNIIMALEFIRDQLPKTLEEADRLAAGLPEDGFRKA